MAAGARGGDVQAQLPAEARQRRLVALALERHQHADLAEPVGDLVVHVLGDEAVADRHGGRAAHAHVLADGGHHLLDVVGHRHRLAGIGQRQQLVEVAAGLRRQRGDVAHHVLELLVAGDEVGLRVDLDHRPRLVLGGDADQALGGDAAGLVGGLRQALLAQPVDGLLDVALGLGQRRLAVHHAGAGLVAQLLHQAGGDVGHRLVLTMRSRAMRDASWRDRGGTACTAIRLASYRSRLSQAAWPSTSCLAAATQPSRAIRPLRLRARSSASVDLGVEIGDLPVVEDAGVIEALLELGIDARQALQVVGLAARRIDALEGGLLALDRQLLGRRRLGGADIDAGLRPGRARCRRWRRARRGRNRA